MLTSRTVMPESLMSASLSIPGLAEIVHVTFSPWLKTPALCRARSWPSRAWESMHQREITADTLTERLFSCWHSGFCPLRQRRLLSSSRRDAAAFLTVWYGTRPKLSSLSPRPVYNLQAHCFHRRWEVYTDGHKRVAMGMILSCHFVTHTSAISVLLLFRSDKAGQDACAIAKKTVEQHHYGS